MALVIDPRKPLHLVPVVVGNWANNILSLAVSIYLVTENPSVTSAIFGIIGLVLEGFMCTIGVRNGIFLLFNYSRPNDEDLEIELQCASHLFITSMFGWLTIFSPHYWEYMSWRACKYRMHPTFLFYTVTEVLLVDGLFAPVLLYALTKRPAPVVYAKMVTGVVSVFWFSVRIFFKKCLPWCPKVHVAPEKGEAPDDPTPY